MPRFALTTDAIETAPLRAQLLDARAGAFASFEGWVRDNNQGQRVSGLHYQAYVELAQAEGEKVIDEALSKFDILDARCVHRTGELAIGEMAVWVGVSAGHRDGAFAACRWIIDQAKLRVPIWKRERYASGTDEWLHPQAPEIAD
ncbi:molybdenum cofactor biosynthesis protein MoaE [Pseudoxanthomonas sp.]|uniref:molybdenum cofactor biosynthesis protein MoaE n=1 Tax=Pseudoxanthomonas sp. TaxID=1871049 RepID=UPI002602BD37|nr:molybdenum cofactor biosynthesis protein MoaE [Pseudoxanthomonas sp.]WDS36118.1 MAG: molybdenum cofactor biosynthesis protein MoaE [Pseudoxanthomonas sp.]